MSAHEEVAKEMYDKLNGMGEEMYGAIKETVIDLNALSMDALRKAAGALDIHRLMMNGQVSDNMQHMYEALEEKAKKIADPTIDTAQAIVEFEAEYERFQREAGKEEKAREAKTNGASKLPHDFDVNDLSEGAQAIIMDDNEYEKTIDVAKEDLKNAAKDIRSISKERMIFATEHGLVESYCKKDDVIKDMLKSPIACGLYDAKMFISQLKGGFAVAKQAEMNYEKAKMNYSRFVCEAAKMKVSEGFEAAINFARTTMEKAGNIFKAAVSRLNEMIDICKTKFMEALVNLDKNLSLSVDKISGGEASFSNVKYESMILKEIENTKERVNKAPYFDDVEKAERIEELDKIAKVHENRKEFWQDIHDQNWGKDSMSKIEKAEQKIKEIPGTFKEAIDRAVVNVHNATIEAHARALELGAKAYEAVEKMSTWSSKSYEHVKKGLEDKDKKLGDLRNNLYDAVDKFTGIQKKENTKYEPSVTLVHQLNILDGMKLSSDTKDYIRGVIENRIKVSEGVHNVKESVKNTLEYTGKKITGFAPALAAAVVNDNLKTQIEINEKAIDRLDKKIMAESKVKESMRNSKEVILGMAEKVREQKIMASGKDNKADDSGMDMGDR